MLERTSAIAAGLARGSRLRDGRAGVKLGELRGQALLQLAGFPSSMARIEAAVRDRLKAAPPTRIGISVRAADALILRTGPEQIWIAVPGETLPHEQSLRDGIAPAMGVVTSLSHSRTRMIVEGARARDVLAKGIAIDLHPDMFATDRFALTGLDHTPVLLLRAAPDRYEVWAMRTFALTVWDWLTNSALEFGYEVGRGQ